MKTMVVNLMGAAGSGKSTLAAEVFYHLKKKGFNCEYVQEYAKSIVYEENFNRLNNQLIVFSNQYYNLDMLRGKVDIIITDSPLLVNLFYNKNRGMDTTKIPDEIFDKLVLYCHKSFDNLNYFIKRNHEYKQEGRYQDEEQAKLEEGVIFNMLKDFNIDFDYMLSSDDCASKIVEDVEKRVLFYNNLQKSGMEIEKKFLVDILPKNLKDYKNSFILQGYIENGEHERRVRNVDNKQFFLTEKYGVGLKREEFEKEITSKEFAALIKQAGRRLVKKIRYYVPVDEKHIAELDIYIDKHDEQGNRLKTVEVEFQSEKDALTFNKPSWFGREVTKDSRFKNSTLAEKAI